MSLRSFLIALILLVGLTFANYMVYQRQVPQANPYAQGSTLGSIAAAASVPDQQSRAIGGFWWREAGAVLITGVLLFAFSGAVQRR